MANSIAFAEKENEPGYRNKKRVPDFFIVGAPKCGTTSMYEYLGQHPEIFMSPIKEPHYLAADLHFKKYRVDKIEDYLSLFENAADKKMVGEASAMYLYSKVAATAIKELSPSAKIIIMLRNPTEMLYSLHSQLLSSMDEDIEDFQSALNAEAERKKGLRIPKSNTWAIECMFYRDVVKYAEQIQIYLNLFGKERIHIVIYDDLKKDTSRIYKEVLHFLDVNEDFQPVFKVVNPNKRIRFKYIRNLILFERTPPIISMIVRTLLPKLVRVWMRERINQIMIKLTTQYTARKLMDSELKKSLQAEFAPEVEKLSKLLDRDLTHWNRS